MPMDSVTDENIAKLNKEHAEKTAELDVVLKNTTQNMWLSELAILAVDYDKYRDERIRSVSGEKKKVTKIVKKVKSAEKKALVLLIEE